MGGGEIRVGMGVGMGVGRVEQDKELYIGFHICRNVCESKKRPKIELQGNSSSSPSHRFSRFKRLTSIM